MQKTHSWEEKGWRPRCCILFTISHHIGLNEKSFGYQLQEATHDRLFRHARLRRRLDPRPVPVSHGTSGHDGSHPLPGHPQPYGPPQVDLPNSWAARKKFGLQNAMDRPRCSRVWLAVSLLVGRLVGCGGFPKSTGTTHLLPRSTDANEYTRIHIGPHGSCRRPRFVKAMGPAYPAGTGGALLLESKSV